MRRVSSSVCAARNSARIASAPGERVIDREYLQEWRWKNQRPDETGKVPDRPQTLRLSGRFAGRGRGEKRFGSLKVTTTRVRPGYLRKNGVPYSADIRMTEYWDVITDPGGVQRLMVTQQLEDPEYLFRTWITTYNFKKEPDGSKWDPSPCSSRW